MNYDLQPSQQPVCIIQKMALTPGDASNSQLLQKSWFSSAGIPSLNKQTALEYFSQRSNPFYDRTCNNEVIRMQRADPEQLT